MESPITTRFCKAEGMEQEEGSATAAQALTAGSSELLSASVRRLLLDRIVHGVYRPGERIVELQLARELGLSQSPVREALRDLAAIGVVTMHARRGARVRLASAKELADVSVVRAEIDALAARLVAEHASDAFLTMLTDLIDTMFRRFGEQDFPALTEADVQFHRLIAEESTNHAIVRAFDQLAPFGRTFITLTLPDVDVREILGEHRLILAALAARDPDAAAAAARAHQLSVGRLLQTHHTAQQAAAQESGAAPE